MKRLKIVPLLLIALLLCLPATPASAAIDANPIMRIGLYYNNNALPEAKLQNAVGSGYAIGTYNNGRTFSYGFAISDTTISMFKNKTMVYASNAFSESGSGTKIGAYSIDYGEAFINEAAMYNQVSALKSNGLAAYPCLINGNLRVRIGQYIDESTANSALSAMSLVNGFVVSPSTSCITIGNFNNGAIVAQYDNTAGFALGVLPQGTDTQTWFKGYKYNGGFEYNRRNGNDITVINIVTMQQYIKGVLPYEMNNTWHIEALKAQAVAARSFAYFRINWHTAKYGCDMCNTTCCQVYRGVGAGNTNAQANERTDQAVDDTAGVYAMYNGKPAMTVYHSSDGGQTESAELMWGGTYPYLQPVTDPYEVTENAYRGIWSFEYTNEMFTQILRDKGKSVGNIVDAYVEERTPAGNVYKLTFVDDAGKTYSFTGESARTIINSSKYDVYTWSQRYWLTKKSTEMLILSLSGQSKVESADGLYAVGGDGVVRELNTSGGVYVITASGTQLVGDGSSGYVMSGRGWGNNIGMSQYGAKDMAALGFTYNQILEFYYKGVTVEHVG